MTSKAISGVLSYSGLTDLISQFAGSPQTTLRVSKAFASFPKFPAVSDRICKNLHSSYLANSTLKSYVALNPPAGGATDVTVVRDVYTRVLQRASAKAPVAPAIDSLNPTRLENLSKATDLLIFFEKVADQLPSALNFLNGLTGNIYERAGLIQQWMNNNSESLKTITYLNLENCNLFSLPQEIRFFTGLEKLYLGQ